MNKLHIVFCIEFEPGMISLAAFKVNLSNQQLRYQMIVLNGCILNLSVFIQILKLLGNTVF